MKERCHVEGWTRTTREDAAKDQEVARREQMTAAGKGALSYHKVLERSEEARAGRERSGEGRMNIEKKSGEVSSEKKRVEERRVQITDE